MEYEIHEVEKFYDNNVTDRCGYPVEQRRQLGASFTDSHEPKVGDSLIFKENGKLFERIVVSVHSNGNVWEDVESLDVEYYTREIEPDQFVIVNREDGLPPFGCVNLLFGVMNGRGEITVPIEYDEIEWLPYPASSYLKVRKKERWGVIDCMGNIKIPVKYDSIIYPFDLINKFDNYLAGNGGHYLCYDRDFKIIPQDLGCFKIISELYDGLFIVHGGKQYSYGMVDRLGKVILPLSHNNIACFGNELIIAEKNWENKFCRYICNKRGKIIVDSFDTIHRLVKNKFGLSFSPETVRTNQQNLCGNGIYKIGRYISGVGNMFFLIDGNGKYLLKGRYDEIIIGDGTIYTTFKTNPGHKDIHDEYDAKEIFENAGLHDFL